MRNQILGLVRQFASTKLEEKKFIPGKTQIPASSPKLSEDNIVSLADAVLDMWYTEGKHCAEFERSLSKVVGKSKVLLCNSGSSASLLAVLAETEQWKHGKFIVTTALGFPTTVSAIYHAGKIPIYIDFEDYSFEPNHEQLDYIIDKYGDDVCGAIFAHTMGFPFDELAITQILGHRWLISDACDALGATINRFGTEVHVGYLSDMIVFSFFPAHHIFSGEGGAVLTNDRCLYDIARSYSNWGRSCYCEPGQSNACGHRFDWQERGKLPEGWDHKYIFDRLGYNLKMTELQAALGNSQIQQLDHFVDCRRHNYSEIVNYLLGWEDFIFPTIPEWSNPSPFGVPIFVDNKFIGTNNLIRFLEDHKISTRRLFGGNITRQPGYMNLPYVTSGDLYWSDYFTDNAFWIGCGPWMTNDMLTYVLSVFNDFMRE